MTNASLTTLFSTQLAPTVAMRTWITRPPLMPKKPLVTWMKRSLMATFYIAPFFVRQPPRLQHNDVAPVPFLHHVARDNVTLRRSARFVVRLTRTLHGEDRRSGRG